MQQATDAGFGRTRFALNAAFEVEAQGEGAGAALQWGAWGLADVVSAERRARG